MTENSSKYHNSHPDNIEIKIHLIAEKDGCSKITCDSFKTFITVSPPATDYKIPLKQAHEIGLLCLVQYLFLVYFAGLRCGGKSICMIIMQPNKKQGAEHKALKSN